MIYEFFGKTYDSEENKQAESYFQKMRQWILNATSAAKQQLKSILEKSKYASYLIEGRAFSEEGLLLESFTGRLGLSSTTDEEIFGSKKKQLIDHSLDDQVFEAFGGKKKKREGSEKSLTLRVRLS